jgi:hypothetical protein
MCCRRGFHQRQSEDSLQLQWGALSPLISWRHQSKRLNEAGTTIGSNEGKTQRRPTSEGALRPQPGDEKGNLEK